MSVHVDQSMYEAIPPIMAWRAEIVRRMVERTKAEIDRVGVLTLAKFTRLAWHVVEPSRDFIPGWHLDCISDHLEAITRGELIRLLITLPPGMMKSLLVSVFWNAYEWGPAGLPAHRFIGFSYDKELSSRDSLKTRRLIQSSWYQQLWGDKFKLTDDQNVKCLAGGTQILMADGTLRAIENVKRGDEVISYDLAKHHTIVDRVVNAWSNGVQPVRRITLSDGTVIMPTLNHRLYSWDRWLYVADMKVGDSLSVVNQIPRQYGQVAVDDAFLLALWLADGSKGDDSFAFTKDDPGIVDRAKRIARERGWAFRTNKSGITHTLSVSFQQTGDTPNGLLKRAFGVERTYGTRSVAKRPRVDTIRVPAMIMSGSDQVVREFLSTYIACDGSVLSTGPYGIQISTVSERMAFDLLLLLKRFGVQGRISHGRGWYLAEGVRKEGRICWCVNIMSATEVLKLDQLYLFGKDDRLRELLARCHRIVISPRGGGRDAGVPPHDGSSRWMTNRVAVEEAETIGDATLLRKLDGALSWRKVVSIEDVGTVETFHIETRKTSLFFAEGILSHNTRWENDRTGYRIADYVGGGTGDRGDRDITDDPHNVRDGESDAKRNSALLWLAETLPTRLNDPEKSAIVVIHHRIHPQDIAGEIIEKDLGYEHIMLPMEFEPRRRCYTSLKRPGLEPQNMRFLKSRGIWLPEDWRPVGEEQVDQGLTAAYDDAIPRVVYPQDQRTKDGELLFPQRFPKEVVERDKKAMGSYAVAGQFQQRPAPRGGGMFKRVWFEVVGEAPSDCYWVRYWDLAATESAHAAFTAGVLMGRSRSNDVFYVGTSVRPGVIRAQIEGDAVKKLIKQVSALDLMAIGKRNYSIGLPKDPGQAGKVQAQDLVSMLAGYNVRAEIESGDKETRAVPYARQAEAGNVKLIGGPWVEPYLAELEIFPAGRFKDQGDASSGAFGQLLLYPRMGLLQGASKGGY